MGSMLHFTEYIKVEYIIFFLNFNLKSFITKYEIIYKIRDSLKTALVSFEDTD